MIEILQANEVSFSYGLQPILQSVTLSLQQGQVVALLGPNGSGKSTLLKTLLGQMRSVGTIQWEGRSIHDWSWRELARRVAYLPQFPTFAPDQTVSETLRLGRSPYWGAFGLESTKDLSAVRKAAQLLQLNDLLDRRMDELSGGQRQRAMIGRCLAQEPAALLLDEPTTFLDLRHQVELSKLLRQFAKEQNMAVLLASHDLTLAGAYADRLLLLSEGRVVAEGEPNVVLEPELLARIYGVTIRRIDSETGPVVYAV